MTDVHHKLLELAGFSPANLMTDLPKWRRTADRLGLNHEDVRFAVESWLPEQWDLRPAGIRQVLGVLLKELMALCDPVNPKGLIRMYTALPFPPGLLMAIKMAKGEGLRIFTPDVLLNVALGAIFHKVPDWLDPALGRNLLGASCQRCGLNQMRVAAQSGGVIPPADVTWTAGVFCDEASKVEEYLECLGETGRPSHVSRLPQDAAGHMSPAVQAERVEHVKRQLELGLDFLKQTVQVEVSHKFLRAGIDRWRRYAFKLASLNSLMLRNDPPPMGGFESTLFALPRIMSFGTGWEGMETALHTALAEARRLCSQGRGVVPRGTPRLLMYQIPFSQPQFTRLFESSGMALAGSLAVALKPAQTVLSPGEDPLGVLSQVWAGHPGISGLDREAAAICGVVGRYRPDGLVMGLFDFDRRLGTLQPLMVRIIRERTGCPVFYLEGDVWGQRAHPVLQLGERLENIRGIILRSRTLTGYINELKGKMPRWETCSPV